MRLFNIWWKKKCFNHTPAQRKKWRDFLFRSNRKECQKDIFFIVGKLMVYLTYINMRWWWWLVVPLVHVFAFENKLKIIMVVPVLEFFFLYFKTGAFTQNQFLFFQFVTLHLKSNDIEKSQVVQFSFIKGKMKTDQFRVEIWHPTPIDALLIVILYRKSKRK